jgi:CheY-like chemotaxis protein
VIDVARESPDRRVVSLVVDDYDDARATVREMLEELGHEVVEAENGQEAFDYVISHPDVRVQLIVLDLRMPVMNGWEFLALMRSYVRLSRIPIVVAMFSASRAASGPENQIPIPDYDRHFALIAEVFGDGREVEIGVAGYVVAGREECAEIAVAVADARQRQGVGERLLGGLIQVAARRGLRWLEGEVLATNEPMLALARKLRFQVRSRRRSALTVTIDRHVGTADEERLALKAPPSWFAVLRGLAWG